MSTPTPAADLSAVPFEKRRFRTAAQHYLQGRQPYAPALFQRLMQLTGTGPKSRVMDLGCGPGQIAVALAPHVGEVTAIDPEPEMLRVAENAAAAHPEIRFIQASSDDLGPALGRFRLVVIGRAFHWMDRAGTLQRRDGLVEPGGAVALLGTREPELPDNAWVEAYDTLIERYAADDKTRRERKSPDWLRHEAVLLESPFSRIETIAVLERRLTPVERFVDRALSMSSTSAARIGEKTAALAAEVRNTLAPFAAEGMIREVVRSAATIAWRPGG